MIKHYKSCTCFMILLLCFLGNSVDAQNSTRAEQDNRDWPSFLGPDRNSKSTETGILKDWSNGKLETKWTAEVGKGYSLGAVSNGCFFQFDAVGKTCRLICRDANSGDEKWKFEYPFEYKDMYQFEEGPRCTPIVDENRVYIYGVEGMLHCLDAKDGKVIWKKNLNRQFGVVQNFFGVGSTPVVHDRFLICMVGGSPSEDQKNGQRLNLVKPNGSAVVVFDKVSGEVLHKIGDDLASYSSVQLYRDQQKVFAVAWMRDNVIGIDFERGSELWSYPFRARKYESVNAATPVVKGAEILLTESYGPGSVLLDVSNASVKKIWNDTDRRNRSMASHWNTPVLVGDYFYGCSGEGRATNDVRCVQWTTGKVMWKERGFGRSSLTYVDGHLILLDENGKLVLFKASPTSFDEVTRYQDKDGDPLPIEYPCWAAPIVANGKLYVRGKNTIVCLQLKK